MLYLTGQILLIVLFATFVGLALGWWSRGVMAEMHDDNVLEKEGDADPFGARSRLEQCHRDNAALRRELKEAQELLAKYQQAEQLGDDLASVTARLQEAESRVSALMEDLQLRDDTIAVLENELEKLR